MTSFSFISETCLFTTTTSTTTMMPTTSSNDSSITNPSTGESSSSGSNTAAVVGAVLSILLLIAIIIIAFLIYQKYFKGKKSQIQHRQSMKGNCTDIKQPLPPDSDFTLSELNLKREPTMSDDLVVDSLSPRDRAIPMEQYSNRNYI
ncbi:uncharacterized protein LOC134696597 isoform X2 [Mytilus trossulus]|uniref:uncharacterized protein LOC134696597 isoform X2 n=1 Tax=Mytilus trossulus TaxID=6551 RepID=UPI0030045F51